MNFVAANNAIFGLVGSRERPIRNDRWLETRPHRMDKISFLDARADAYRRAAIVCEMNLILLLLCMRKYHRSMISARTGCVRYSSLGK
jgi:hypothetical protein